MDKIEELKKKIEQLNESISNLNEKNDAESIERTKLEIEKSELQEQLKVKIKDLNELKVKNGKNEKETENKNEKRNPWSPPSIAGYDDYKREEERRGKAGNADGRDGATDGNGTADNVYDDFEENKNEKETENKKRRKPEHGRVEQAKGSYNKKLDEYNKILDIYNDDLERLYDLQRQYENGEIEYSQYQEYADYMVERYRFVMSEYNKVLDEYNKDGKNNNPYKDLSNEELNKKLEELENELRDEYQFRAHEENGMEEHDDNYLDELKEKINDIKDEMNDRKEKNNNPYKDLSDEELNKKLEELENELRDEYQFRAHEENGMEEHDDNYLDELNKKIKQIKDEKANREGKVKPEEPEEPEQPMMIKEIEKTPTPTPTPTLTPENKLPSLSFWEIVDKTDTEHANSVSIYFKRLADLHPLKNITPLNAITVPVQGVMKGIGKIVDKFTKASEKKEIMQDNIDELSEEEFDVLVNGMKEETMRQNKFNDLYLDAISERLTKRQNNRINEQININEDSKEVLATIDEKEKEFQEKLRNPALHVDEKEKIENALSYLKNQKAVYEFTKMASREKQEEAMKVITDFDRGKMNKSSRRMNIQGWLAGVFNPDNRELNHQMALLEREKINADERGDSEAYIEAGRKMEQLEKENTKEIKFFGSDKCVISRGLRKHEEVVQRPNDANQTKGAQLAMNIAMIANMVAIGQQLNAKNMQQGLDDHLAKHNEEVRNINAQNADVQTQINNVKDMGTPNEDWVKAAEYEISRGEVEHLGIGHNTEFINSNNGVGFNVNGSDDFLHATDEALHISTESVKSSLTGDHAQDFSTLVEHNQQVINPAVQEMARQGLETARQWSATTRFSENGFVDGLEKIMESNGSTGLDILNNLSVEISKVGDVSMVPEIGAYSIEIPSSLMPNIIAASASTIGLIKTDRQRTAEKANKTEMDIKTVDNIEKEESSTDKDKYEGEREESSADKNKDEGERE